MKFHHLFKSPIAHSPTRRLALKSVAASALLWSFGLSMSSSVANALDNENQRFGMNFDVLIKALRKTGNDACLKEAARLTETRPASSGFYLHLRSANLSLDDAINISNAMGSATEQASDLMAEQKEHSMRSFSISYNRNVQDAGAVSFIHNLPKSITEIGMVGCDLGDETGEALLQWIHQANALKMICVEGNNFSSDMRQKLSKLAATTSGLLVIV
ncbi:MAG: hypothetical protein AB8B94_17440 [Hyphomicrobiales bacterium]